MQRPSCVSCIQIHGQLFSECWAHIPAAGKYLADRVDQFVGRHVFVHVAGSTRPQHAFAVLVLGMHAQNQHWELWLQPLQFTEDLNATPSGHCNVQNDQVPFLLLNLLENLFPICRFPTDRALKSPQHDLFRPRAEHGVVVGYQNSDHRFVPSWLPGPCGIRTSTAVPFPGLLVMVKSPPSSVTRSRIPRIPSDPPLRSFSSWIPLPLSRTSNVTLPSSVASRAFTSF